MFIDTITSLSEIDPGRWNSLELADNPFVRYEFLQILEESGCVGGNTGWQPSYKMLYSNEDRQRLLAAVPAYLKQHSYGEYIFDWAWSNAYHRAGLRYYPKLVVAVPFTPATGPRVLLHADAPPESFSLLAEALIQQAQQQELSTVQWLFLPGQDAAYLEQRGWSSRTDCQFHWENASYIDFAGFLATFSSKKRKNVIRERRHVREAGIVMRLLSGAEISSQYWDIFYRFYRSTIIRHGGQSYLNREFFHLLGEKLSDLVILVIAEKDEQLVAASLNLLGRDTLYGRYWGCLADYNSLHFETCYYQAIEYCIEHGIKRFEAGAQGQHKLSRGFLPTKVYSANWLRHPEFSDAVKDYLQQEGKEVEDYMEVLNDHSPFRAGNDAGT